MRSSLLVILAGLAGVAPACGLQVTSLRCDGAENPIAVRNAQPDFGWQLAATEPDATQAAYRILVASSRQAIAAGRGDLWDSGKVASSHTLTIPYAGKSLTPAAENFWKVQVWDASGRVSSWSAVASFRLGLLRAEDWKARWIAAQPDGATPDLRLPVFRREVRIDAPVERAIAYISGLGQYELRINGRKIGNDVLSPGWTNYRKTVLYNSFDVTSALKRGDNAIGVMLGNGFFHVPRIAGRYTKLVESFGQPKLIVQIHLQLAGGRSMTIVSDAGWQFSPGPITTSHVYGGEDYDARLETPQAQDWKPALEVAGPGGELTAQSSPPVRVMQTYPAVRITEPKPGLRVYDLGQNMSGWPHIVVHGPAGATVKMIPGELLKPDGLVSQQSSGSPVWFSYTLKGTAAEEWNPRFSYYGFRYVQVEGITGGVQVDRLEGQFVHSSAPVTGEFSCSNDLFNKIHKLIDLAVQSNMQSVLTDCPHREKLGWLEESHLLGSAVMYNYGVEGLYVKIAEDIRDSQTENGLVPDIAPEYTVFAGGFRDSPEWGSAVVLDPWLVYRHFGNRRNLAAHFDDMLRYVGYLKTKAVDGIISYGLGDWYDIGPKPPGVSQLTGLGVTATAVYYQDLITLRRIAGLLGKRSEEQRLREESDAVRTTFNARLFDARTGVYDRGSQTAYAMPLALGLVPEDRRAEVLKKLVDDIEAHRFHTTAGDVGFHYVVQALSEGDRSDVIYKMLSAKDPPSYAGQIAAGATTLTEAWDAQPASSQNHFMLGHAEEWFYRYLAGIDFDLSRATDQRIVLRPTPVGDVTWAKASLATPLGTIVSSWRKDGPDLVYDVEVPVNARATVILPSGRREVIGAGKHRFEDKQANPRGR